MNELTEREWSDSAGTHYEARIALKNGRVVSEQVTRFPHIGWIGMKAAAAERVKAAAAVKA